MPYIKLLDNVPYETEKKDKDVIEINDEEYKIIDFSKKYRSEEGKLIEINTAEVEVDQNKGNTPTNENKKRKKLQEENSSYMSIIKNGYFDEILNITLDISITTIDSLLRIYKLAELDRKNIPIVIQTRENKYTCDNLETLRDLIIRYYKYFTELNEKNDEYINLIKNSDEKNIDEVIIKF